MTVEQLLTQHLTNCGLWPDEAQHVVETMKASNKTMYDRWQHPHTDYTPALIATLAIEAKQLAVDWIDANKPDHFARNSLIP